jgi:exodeoxyribonuclease-3
LNVLRDSGADLFLLQETRAFPEDLDALTLSPDGYQAFFFPAAKAGYSGVGIYTRTHRVETEVVRGLGIDEFDREGRWLEVRIPAARLAVVTAYFPNSQREGMRLPYKIAFCRAALERLRLLEALGFGVVLAGDLNIAHQERDLANPKQNHSNPGFLPQERAWFDELAQAGFIDTFRLFEEGSGHYTWWSARPGVREKNIGWRIDYHVASRSLADRVKSSRIHSGILGSDHCPVSLDLAL